MDRENNYYIVLPTWVLADDRLSPAEKIILGDINSLKEYWKANSTIADAVGVSIRTVTRGIANLEKLGFIKTELITGKGLQTYRQIHKTPKLFGMNLHDEKSGTPTQNDLQEIQLNNIKDNREIEEARVAQAPLTSSLVSKNLKSSKTLKPLEPIELYLGVFNEVTGRSLRILPQEKRVIAALAQMTHQELKNGLCYIRDHSSWAKENKVYPNNTAWLIVESVNHVDYDPSERMRHVDTFEKPE